MALLSAVLRHGAVMRAFASSFHAWKMLERQEGVKVPHGLTFPLAIVEAIGRPHGLAPLIAEEHSVEGPSASDAIFLSVLDARCMVGAARHFRSWGVPFRSCDRRPIGRFPLVWAGGQGLHNPLPLAPCFDLAVIGDAEDVLPELLRLWMRHGNTTGFLAAASTVAGVFVPDHHDRRVDTITQAVSADIGITLREDISVNLNGQRRVEIARGCQYKCTFCSLGWRTPLRENSGEQIIATIKRSPKVVHLQAGDAESHSEISAVRDALRAHGGRDNGWTGRLDTLLDNPDVEADGTKKYAFGVEGISFRLRRAVGKGYLTDDRLVSDTGTFFDAVIRDAERRRVDTRGRAAWHVIAGLPTERLEEIRDMREVLRALDDRQRGKGRVNLTLHWQPFEPVPGTPMQWCPAGAGARRLAAALRDAEGMDWVSVRQLGGRTDEMGRICAVLARSDERGAALIEAMADGAVSVRDAERITGSTCGQIDPDVGLPWSFVRTHVDPATLRRAYDVMMSRLRG